jgi:hypothetical protein
LIVSVNICTTPLTQLKPFQIGTLIPFEICNETDFFEPCFSWVYWKGITWVLTKMHPHWHCNYSCQKICSFAEHFTLITLWSILCTNVAEEQHVDTALYHLTCNSKKTKNVFLYHLFSRGLRSQYRSQKEQLPWGEKFQSISSNFTAKFQGIRGGILRLGPRGYSILCRLADAQQNPQMSVHSLYLF